MVMAHKDLLEKTSQHVQKYKTRYQGLDIGLVLSGQSLQGKSEKGRGCLFGFEHQSRYVVYTSSIYWYQVCSGPPLPPTTYPTLVGLVGHIVKDQFASICSRWVPFAEHTPESSVEEAVHEQILHAHTCPHAHALHATCHTHPTLMLTCSVLAVIRALRNNRCHWD